MKRFYTNRIRDGVAVLSDTERDHCVRVLRTVVGEAVEVVNGEGGWAVGRLAHSSKQEAVIELQDEVKVQARPVMHTIATAIPKNPSRWEYFIEKATEVGVGTIIPVICHRSEKQRIRMDRSRQIILSAFKQSQRFYLPVLSEAVQFERFIAEEHIVEEKAIACITGEDESPFLGVVHRPGKTCLVMIGPEGDFTPEEISLAVGSGFKPVGLGPNRLRVETAALTACTILTSIDQIQ